ncbi:hypothetical protein HHI36_017776 [Cryptolaemus montrouzieri]|uniref:tubulin-glutamate carboxypeptidase n=1 Tax=Cryptolaemus montrouzieri TaxID=559131 RepID=A0ABD2NNW9_9CUCU
MSTLVMEDIRCSGVTFIRNFDSANLAKVEAVPYDVSVLVNSGSHSSTSTRILPEIPDQEFNIWTTPDCGGTEFENGNRTWFYFGMRANAPSILIKLNIVDLNKQAKMYSQGMCPVYKVVPSRMGWDRIRDKPTYNNEDEIFTLSFRYRTPENSQAITYFAFTYPFSYSDIQKMLSNIDAKFATTPLVDNDDIYYVRECVCHSLDNRRVDLLTITSKKGMSNAREARLKNLFTNENVPRPHRFPDKKVIFLSARVHPGETPSSFVFNGFLHLLLNREDQVAIALRRMYVFKLIPCLNPDGVARGHYRTDSRGVNLNRLYLNPSLTLNPSIYAARALIRYYHYGYEKPDSITLCANCIDGSSAEPSTTDPEDHQSGNVISSKVSNMSLEESDTGPICFKLKKLCTICGSPLRNSSSSESIDKVNGKGDVNPVDSGLFLYMDLHGHASKKGIFMYGNHFETTEQNVECMLLAKLMSINNHNFHFTACNFSERNMFIKDRRDGMSRAGSGRVAISTITGLIKSYTLECNYNTGRIVNVLPPTIKERQQKGYALPVPPKYSPTVFEEVGRSLGASILDLTGNNPLTRLPHSEFHSLNGVMDWIRTNCIQDFGESTQNNNSRSKMKSSLTQVRKKRYNRSSSDEGVTINSCTIS